MDGKPAARHGDKTACGATLIAGQQATIDKV
nr:PAAR domain-containing protein [Massilia varians]